MSKTLYDLSGKIDPSTIEALVEIARVAAGLNLGFFIVGATARDILMEHVHNIRAPRMTKDIDIAVCVADWSEYKALTEGLVATGRFAKRAQVQRYDFGGASIDIIPFGDISGRENRVSWPPDHETVMSTAGLRDNYEHAITCRLSHSPVLDVKVAPIPGLAILKLLAWNEGYPEREKDAQDLLFLLRTYQRAGVEDRLYDQEADMLMEEGFDNERAGIRLLGRDMAAMSNLATGEAIKAILGRETDESSDFRLVNQMSRDIDNADHLISNLEKLKQGFNERLGL